MILTKNKCLCLCMFYALILIKNRVRLENVELVDIAICQGGGENMTSGSLQLRTSEHQ